mgnify:CR=1 FL=1
MMSNGDACGISGSLFLFMILEKSNAASKSASNKNSDKDKNFLAAPKGPSVVPPSPRRVKKEPMKKDFNEGMTELVQSASASASTSAIPDINVPIFFEPLPFSILNKDDDTNVDDGHNWTKPSETDNMLRFKFVHGNEKISVHDNNNP